MNHLEYLRTWGEVPDFDDIFNTVDAPLVENQEITNDSTTDSETEFRFPKGEPGAYLGDQPTFSDFLEKIDDGKSRVLDVGCGIGRYRNEVNSRGQYLGLDFDASFHPEFVCDLNNEPFPFPDESFDFVFSDSVLEHVTDPIVVMDEIYRVLKEDGEGYLLVPFHYKAHGSPYEFFRFSKGGVHLLLKKFTNIQIYPIGGSLSVLCHIFWNYGRIFDQTHVMIGNIWRTFIWSIFKILNKLDRFDPYKNFTRGHYAFFSKDSSRLQNE